MPEIDKYYPRFLSAFNMKAGLLLMLMGFFGGRANAQPDLLLQIEAICESPRSFSPERGKVLMQSWASLPINTNADVSDILVIAGGRLYSFFVTLGAFDHLQPLCRAVTRRMEPFREDFHTEYWTWHGREAEALSYIGDAQASEQKWLAVVDSLLNQPVTDSLFVGEIYLQLTRLSHTNQWFDQGVEYGQLGIDYLVTYHDTDMFASLLLVLGRIYLIQGKTIQAITHFRRAIDILETIPEAKKQRSALTVPYVEVASAYANQGKYDLCRAFYRRAVEGMAYPKVNYSDQITILGNLVGYYRNENDSLALHFLDRALATYDLGKKIGEPVSESSKWMLLIRKGRILYQQGKWEESERLLARVLNEAASEQAQFPVLFAANVLVTRSLELKQPMEALQWWQVGYHALQGDFSLNRSGWSKKPETEDMSVSLNLARFFLYRVDALLLMSAEDVPQGIDPVALAEDAVLKAQQLLLQVRRTMLERSQQFNDVYQACQGRRLEVLFRKKPPGLASDAFRLMDRSKAISLQEDWVFEQRKRHGPIPDSMKRSLEQLEREVVELETQVFEDELLSGGDPKAGSRAYENKSVLVEKSRELHRVREAINNQFPTFALSDSQYPFVPLEEVRAKLMPDHSGVLSFFYTPTTLFSAYLSVDTSLVYRQAVNDRWHADLKWLVNRYRSPNIGPDSLLAARSHAFFQTLIGPFEAILPSGGADLMVVPDGPLVELPFEALVTNPVGQQRPEYLIDRVAVSYWLSVRSRLLLEDQASASGSRLASFAPKYPTTGPALANLIEQDSRVSYLVRSGEYELPGAVKEASMIADLWNGEVYTGGVTEEAFLNEASNFSVLHLAMHALVEREDVRFSRLLFTPSEDGSRGFLSALEIADMDLPADMVVLSACNTGQGEWKAGEGVFHLGRAFRMAGVKSLVLSLWQVPDQATSELMPGFYQGLKDGLSKSQALRKAKLDYLSQADQVFTRPYFWAGFVLIGDQGPVHISGSSSLLWWGILLIAGGIILGLGWSLRRKNARMNARTHS